LAEKMKLLQIRTSLANHSFRVLPVIVLFLASSMINHAQNSSFSYRLLEERFLVDIEPEGNAAYFIEQSDDLENWELVAAQSADDPLFESTYISDTSSKSFSFFRFTEKPLNKTPPIITEFALYVGLFHTQTDSNHRIRYHTATELWNPYGFDIELPTDSGDRAYWLVIENLPVIEVQVIRNFGRVQNVALSYTIDLGDIPVDYSGNTVIENLPWDWLLIDSTKLLAGEVYLTGTDSSRGLARTVASSEDRWSWETVQSPSFPMLYSDDEVRITADSCSITIHLIPFSLQPTSVHPLELGEPILSYRNIPFDGFEISLSGAGYSRTSSGSYNKSDFLFGMHFQIDEYTEPNLLPLINPSSVSYDFSDPEISSVFNITRNPFDFRFGGGAFHFTERYSDPTFNRRDSTFTPIILID
jgi:hypothetical protein